MKLRVAASLSLLVVALLLIVVGRPHGTAGDRMSHARPPQVPRSRYQVHVEADAATSYASLAQLRGDANSVVLLRPTTSSRVESVNGNPFTITTVSVEKTISGSPVAANVELRQLGSGNTSGDSFVVSAGRPYVAYVTPFEFIPGQPVGNEYVIIGGDQGLFEGSAAPVTDVMNRAFDPTARAFARVDGSASALPDRISVHDAGASTGAATDGGPPAKSP